MENGLSFRYHFFTKAKLLEIRFLQYFTQKEFVMNKQDLALKLNYGLENIEIQVASIRMCLLCSALDESLCFKKHNLQVISSDEEGISLAYKSENAYNFGILIGYFEDAWWSGLVLFDKDGETLTKHLTQPLQEHLAKHKLKFKLNAEDFVFIEDFCVAENEEFKDFVLKTIDNIKNSQSQIAKLNEALSDFA